MYYLSPAEQQLVLAGMLTNLSATYNCGDRIATTQPTYTRLLIPGKLIPHLSVIFILPARTIISFCPTAFHASKLNSETNWGGATNVAKLTFAERRSGCSFFRVRVNILSVNAIIQVLSPLPTGSEKGFTDSITLLAIWLTGISFSNLGGVQYSIPYTPLIKQTS